MDTNAAPTKKPNLDPIPICLVVPLMRVADNLGTTDDYHRLENAGPAYTGKFPGWLADIDAELAARREDGRPPAPPEGWAEALLVGREARRKLSFVWDDTKGGGELVSTLRDPTEGGGFGGSVTSLTLTGACAPETILRWSAKTPNGSAHGEVRANGPRAIAAAKKAVEHAFLAAWEAMSS